MAKAKTVYVCQQCGSRQARWAGRCPDCRVELAGRGARGPGAGARAAGVGEGEATPITEVESVDAPRMLTGIGEFDRILELA